MTSPGQPELARRLAAQAGIALPVAIIVLFILTMLIAAAVSVALDTNSSTLRDNNVKAALEAAETGLRVATYRLNMLDPGAEKCINKTEATVPEKGNYCQEKEAEQLGNHSEFSYTTTRALEAGVAGDDECVGATVENKSGVIQRCITSVGTVNGVSRRTEARVASFTATPLFPVNGIFGLEEVSLSNNIEAQAPAGTNGKLKLSNNTSVESTTLGKGGEVILSNHAVSGPVTTESSQFVLSPVQPGRSAEMAAAGNCAAETGKNCDLRIANGLKSPQVEPKDQSTGTEFITENSKKEATRELKITNNGSLTLNGGLYNFCNFIASNNVTITLGTGVRTAIFIDNHEDPNSKCPKGSGKFEISNNSNFVNLSQDPTALQIFVFGGEGGTVSISNNATFYGTIYAPSSTVSISNNGGVAGAVAAKVVDLSNNTKFKSDNRVKELQATTVGLAYRTAWEECPPPIAGASSPQSGC